MKKIRFCDVDDWIRFSIDSVLLEYSGVVSNVLFIRNGLLHYLDSDLCLCIKKTADVGVIITVDDMRDYSNDLGVWCSF